jgi:hypothetical protein
MAIHVNQGWARDIRLWTFPQRLPSFRLGSKSTLTARVSSETVPIARILATLPGFADWRKELGNHSGLASHLDPLEAVPCL